ncbi:hypothetical protein CHLNCDRAFT_134795 [Chlorella variabilis]|uniref:U-box domain-containing protein n=1 Tax=Chlorella variabilis TaxID=554065 RepID=E1ZGT0_CHLVA|nr:hypothetical protein CHLNCDRAFT_134795 [Chlorella variabilis]EFN54991.1 hypothetical protein CHLNCDRAFT_134795 [Chlorella variabilis]|eukprot:XP_005847093.1 hypothetical protein CHLNCDRAFT_134795 [Chlorella variabilis]
MLGRLVQRLAGAAGGAQAGRHPQDEDDEGDEDFMDPITFACMQDPVLLCGTGQIYCLSSLRAWLDTGSRTCPKTNVVMRDVEVVRLPSVRSRIAAWRASQGLPPLRPLDPPPEVVREAGAGVAQALAGLRGGDVYRRGLAAGAVNDMLIEWGRLEPLPARQQVMEAMLLDLVWLMRQGTPTAAAVPFEYNRCSAAAAMWGLCKCAAGRGEVRRGGGVRLLKLMALQAEAGGEQPGPLGEKLVRFDKRDASGCLLALRLTEDEAAEEPAVSIPQLRRWNHCSHAWLLGRVAEPTEGYSEDEQAALLPLLATGEEQDETDEEDWEDGAEEEEEGGEGAGAE